MAQPYKFIHEQVVPRPLDEVFSFFSRAENLEQLTPAWLNFNVLSVTPESIRQGTLIRYRLRLHRLPLRWTSKITEWDPPHKFVDVQRHGPYKLWRHTHEFIAEGRNTRIRDEVLYALPFGPLGALAHWLTVRRDVERIFAFREAKIRALFGQP
jgi:ligand-binding SRPBCC domain-containing protein